MHLSKRLEACLEYTNGFQHLVDIGTDHAMLPIHAVKRGYVIDAIAADNKEGPFVIALRNVLRYHLKDKIKVVLSDGFKNIQSPTDVAVISGMGGQLISTIIKTGTNNSKRLVLQPNSDGEQVRKSLHEIGYYIIDEIVLEEDTKLYEVIVAEQGITEYSDLEYKYGPINLKERPYYFLKQLKKNLDRLTGLLATIEDPNRRNEITNEINEISEVLNNERN